MVCLIKGCLSKTNRRFVFSFNTHLGKRWISTLESSSLRSPVLSCNPCSNAGHSTLLSSWCLWEGSWARPQKPKDAIFAYKGNTVSQRQGTNPISVESLAVAESINTATFTLETSAGFLHHSPPRALSAKCPRMAPHCPFNRDSRT